MTEYSVEIKRYPGHATWGWTVRDDQGRYVVSSFTLTRWGARREARRAVDIVEMSRQIEERFERDRRRRETGGEPVEQFTVSA